MSSPDRVPGVSTNYARTSDVSATAPNNRCLLAGLVLPGALAHPGVPFVVQSETQLDSLTGGPMAHASRLYRAGKAQNSSAEFWVMPLPDPGGTKATRPFTVVPAPVFTGGAWQVGTGTGAAQGTTGTIDVAGQVATFNVNTGDLWTAIASSAQAALLTIPDLIVVPTVSSATLTLTDVHAADLGNDLPVRISFDNPACGIGVISGTLTLATTATGGGNLTLTDGIQLATVPITSAETVAVATAAMQTAINLVGPALAVTDPGNAGVISLFHMADRWIRRFTATMTATGMTAVLAQGTPGVGLPTFTGTGGPLDKNSGDQAYKCWAMPFSDVTSLGACATQIVAQDAAPIEKGQVLYTCIYTALPNTPLPTATTPALTTTELTTVLQYQGATVRAGEIAARVAAEVAAENDYGRVYNGLILLGSDEMPLSVPARADRSGRPAWNVAISQGYAPVGVTDGNQPYVVDSTTTFASGSAKTAGLTKWSGALIPIYFRASLRQRLGARFFPPGNGKSVKAYGVPHTNRGITATGVRSECIALIQEWDAADLFDYGTDINAAIQVSIIQTPSTQINVSMPFRDVRDLDKINITGYPA